MIECLSLRILTRLEDYSQYPGDYHDGSFREPDEEEMPLYVDYYRSKCYAYLASDQASLHDF